MCARSYLFGACPPVQIPDAPVVLSRFPLSTRLPPERRGAASATHLDPGVVVPGPVFIESDDLTQGFEMLRSRGVIFVEQNRRRTPFGPRMAALDPDGTGSNSVNRIGLDV